MTEKTFLPGEILSNDVANVATQINIDNAVDPKIEELKKHLEAVDDAISKCKQDPGVLSSLDFTTALKFIRIQSAEDWARIRVKLKAEKPSGILLSDIDKATDPNKSNGGDSTATLIVETVQTIGTLFFDTESEKAYIESEGKVYAVGSKQFVDWASYEYYKKSGAVTSESSLKQAAFTLSGVAKNEGKKTRVNLRTAQSDTDIFVFLADDDWTVVRVSPDGYAKENKPAVKFFKPASMMPLPFPEKGGDINELWRFVNVKGDDRILVLAWMLEAYRPETPFPVLALNGQQGTGKSSSHRRIRQLIDPNASDLRAAPKDIQDIYVSAGTNWVASFENISRLTSQQQDTLCTLATGGGFASRTLYTNDDETIIKVKRPSIINSIPVVVTAQDLTDRVINIELQPIDYIEESKIDAEFKEVRQRLFGALLNLLVKTLAKLPEVKLINPPRLADFAKLGEAMMLALGHNSGEFTKLLKENRRKSVEHALESSPVAVAVMEMAEQYNHGDVVFTGTMKRLKDDLEKYHKESEGWPKSPRGLGDVLRRQQPALAMMGINIKIGRIERIGSERGVSITITKSGNVGNIGNVVSEKSVPEKIISDVEEF